MEMTAEEVAGLLGIGERQLRTYVKEHGLPVQTVGRNRVFLWPQVLEWYVEWKASGATTPALSCAKEDGEDLRSAMTRKLRAEADLKDLALSKTRGEMIVIADVKERLDRMMSGLRVKLLGMPSKLVARLQGVEGREEVEQVCEDELRSVCADLDASALLQIALQHEAGEDEDLEIEAAASPDVKQGLKAGLTNTDILQNLAELLEDYS